MMNGTLLLCVGQEMDKDSWIMVLAILASIVIIVVLNSCSIIEVQVQSGSGVQSKNYDPLDREIHLMKKEQE